MKTSLLTRTAFVVACLSAPIALATPTADQFVKNASIGGNFEVMTSQLALQRSKNADVKTFAQQMITDHTKANNDLKTTVSETKVNPADVMTGLDAKHQKKLDMLKKDSAADFDKDYLSAQKDAHKEAISLFKSYGKSGDNAQLKSFASTTLPTLKEHKKMLGDIKSSM